MTLFGEEKADIHDDHRKREQERSRGGRDLADHPRDIGAAHQVAEIGPAAEMQKGERRKREPLQPRKIDGGFGRNGIGLVSKHVRDQVEPGCDQQERCRPGKHAGQSEILERVGERIEDCPDQHRECQRDEERPSDHEDREDRERAEKPARNLPSVERHRASALQSRKFILRRNSRGVIKAAKNRWPHSRRGAARRAAGDI